MSSPKDRRPNVHSIDPLERLTGDINKRRIDVLGILPNEDAITSLVGTGAGEVCVQLY